MKRIIFINGIPWEILPSIKKIQKSNFGPEVHFLIFAFFMKTWNHNMVWGAVFVGDIFAIGPETVNPGIIL